MADNNVNFSINVQGNASTVVAQLNTQVNQLNQTAQQTESLFDQIGKAALNLNNIVGVISSVTGKMQEFADANKMQQVAESQLAQVMRNTMGASQEEIDTIKELASAQQQLGVIGDEVQLAGAKELGVHLKKADTMKQLLPVMNDFIAKNYGMDASQESAASAGALLGKAMEGNVEALQRSGIQFSEAQKKIMETGTEEERAATLAEVLNEKVGGMNAALAATPEGQVQQAANSFGDLKEAIGQVYVNIQAALVPVVNTAINMFYGIMDVFQRFWPIILGVAGAISVLTVAINAHAIVVGIARKAAQIWTGVQAVLNVVLTANPIGLIIAAIVALIGIIVFLCLKVKGWGTLWDGVVGFVKNSFLGFVEKIKFAWNGMIDLLMIGLNKIKEGWFKFKIAVGLGDDEESRRMLDKINQDTERRKKEIKEGAIKVLQYEKAAFDSLKSINLEWDESVTLKSTTDKLKAQLGITDNSAVNNNGDVNNSNVNNDLSDASTNISSGGKNIKNFNITINDGLVNGVQNYFNSSSDNPESASDFMWRLSNALQMILNDVNYAAQ